MRIIPANSDIYDHLTEIWEGAVRKTHLFLPEERIAFYRTKIREQYLGAVDELEAIEDDNGFVAGFIGVSSPTGGSPAKIEMLFVDPERHGRGLGRQLIEHVVAKHDPVELDVNEQNPGALHFYIRCGFHIVGRSERDAQGDPYPLIHLSNRPFS